MASESVKQARDIISDPNAAERKWLAAAQILSQEPSLPGAPRFKMNLPLALVATTIAAFGSTTLFVGLHATVCGMLTEMTAYQAHASFIAVGYAIWFVPPIMFAMQLSQLKEACEGGKQWKTAMWTVICGYLALVSFWAIDGQAVRLADGALLLLWNAAAMTAAATAALIGSRAYKSLQSTVGARKTLKVSLMSSILFVATFPVLIGGAFLGLESFFGGVALSGIWLGLTGYACARLNGSFNPDTARALAISATSPLTLANLTLIPIMLVTTVYLFATGTVYVSWIDALGALLTTSIVVTLPIVGATIAARQLQRKAAGQLASSDKLGLVGQTKIFNEPASLKDNIAQT